MKTKSIKQKCLETRYGPWRDHKLPLQGSRNSSGYHQEYQQKEITNGPWQDHKLPTIRIINKDSKLQHNQA